MPTVRGRMLAELRRSGAAGIHFKKVPRTVIDKKEIHVSMYEGDDPRYPSLDEEWAPVNDDREVIYDEDDDDYRDTY